MNWKSFLAWEAASRDTIDVKRCYIDVAKDIIAGILLSQIIYWFLPGKNHRPRVTIQKQGRYWLAKKREDWWDECRITPKQFDRAIGILEEKGIVTTRVFKFGPETTKHISLEWEHFLSLLNDIIGATYPGEDSNNSSPAPVPDFPKGKFQNSPKRTSRISRNANPIDTEIPTQITSENTSSPLPPQHASLEEAINFQLPKPFNSLSPEDIAEARELCITKGLVLQDQVDALALEYSNCDKSVSNPRNLLLTVLRINGGVSSVSLSKLSGHRQKQVATKEKVQIHAFSRKQQRAAEEARIAKARDILQNMPSDEKAALESRTIAKYSYLQGKRSIKIGLENCMVHVLADELVM